MVCNWFAFVSDMMSRIVLPYSTVVLVIVVYVVSNVFLMFQRW